MTCIKMGSDESHFNVSLIVRDKVTRLCVHNHNFWRERTAEAVSNRGPFAYQPTALPLGQTGSQIARHQPIFSFLIVWPPFKRQVLLRAQWAQELCESRGGRPGLSVLTSLMVSVDVKQYWTMLTHWSQLVPNKSTDNRHPSSEG